MHGNGSDDGLLDAAVSTLEQWRHQAVNGPTSQVTGAGAVGVAERSLSEMLGDRPAHLVPSATYGMLAALSALGVAAGDEVLVPALDWSSTLACVRMLGATPVVVPVDERTWTIDASAVATLVTSRTKAVVACHLLGVAADVPAVRAAAPGVPIVEDAAASFGSTLDGMLIGTLGDLAVLSFGPGKSWLDAGEAGAVVAADMTLLRRVLKSSAHPVRQRLAGIADINVSAFSMRVHPLAAITLAVALPDAESQAHDARERHRVLAAAVHRASGVRVLGDDPRRANAARLAPFVADAAVLRRLPSTVTTVRHDILDITALAAGTVRSRALTLLYDQ